MFRTMLIAGVLSLAALPALANAPSKDEVAQARQTCRADQSKMAALERNARWCTDDQNVVSARQAAERSCGQAMQLMVAAGLEPKPVAPQPAPPAPTIVIREKVRQGAPETSQPSAEFAAMEVNCEQGGTAAR